ncbi:glycosyltransferase family 2 protein [Arthrobacter sp. 179]|uniref:glycosyltransferase family 2 protein n=1 Tax=Arthrobacter sp. 179 TaxID=3457734 RepID=UPI00403414F4
MPAPYLSIIIPVYNVRAFLRECMDSVLGQTFVDFEVIAINDDSPDGSGEVLDEYQAIDPRVNVLHMNQNIGLGPARNEGIQHAVGRYLLFVDSDDTLVPGALEAIANRLKKTHEPDVLVYDYAREYWNGSIRRNALSRMLDEGDSGCVDFIQRRNLLKVLNVAWNKAYSREFILQHGFAFPTGYYEDIPWTFPILITAPRIAVLDMVCYRYRQRRSGNILGTPSARHLEVFEQYERLFDYVDSKAELEEWCDVSRHW